MFKILVLISIVAYSNGGVYGGALKGLIDGGVGGGVVGRGDYGGVIPAAITSRRSVEVRQVNLPQDPITPQVIEVSPVDLPVKIIYNSKSSGVFVEQIHTPGEVGQVESTRSEEEPHRVSHEVIRPIIQELREVIIPYRRVLQEIQPVVEEIQTTIARGEGRRGVVGLGLGGGIGSGLVGGLVIGNVVEGLGDGLNSGLGGGFDGGQLLTLRGNGIDGGLGKDVGGSGGGNLVLGLDGGLGGAKSSNLWKASAATKAASYRRA